ncbi:hypothetical protein SAMN02910369_02130 [Lachnospiraceae bacterium NE2001]|nr:hypothetical protein SAMN02910369_02130 [Lachnospiraceae bacterium NE2001]
MFWAGLKTPEAYDGKCNNRNKNVISDCITSYDMKKLDEMFAYYGSKGCDVKKLGDYTDEENTV